MQQIHVRFMMAAAIIFLALLPLYSAAQNEADDDDYDHSSHFSGGLSFVSNNVYLGRKDSVRLPYLSPEAGLYNKWGLYARAAVSIALPGGKSHVDVTTIEGGLEKKIGHFEIDAAQSFFFYNKASTAIRSGIRAETDVAAIFNNPVLTPQLSLSLAVSKKQPDFIASLQLSHPIYLYDSALVLAPAAALFGATQNYYNEYLRRRAGKEKAAVVDKSSNFALLDYQLSFEVIFERRHWLLGLTPYYDIPEHPASITLPRRAVTEKLSNTFWLQLDAFYRIKTGKNRR